MPLTAGQGVIHGWFKSWLGHCRLLIVFTSLGAPVVLPHPACRCCCCCSVPVIPASHSPAGILEVAKAAKLLSEIAAVDAEADLSGINAVDADAEFLQTAAAVVRSQTEVRGGGGVVHWKGLQGGLLPAVWPSW